MPAAEETGHIGEIGKWVLNRSCRQAKQWMDETGRACRVGVNVSGRQFDEGDLVTTVSETLSRTGLDPSLLELELTETVVVRDLAKSAVTIQSLRQLGVRIALDDFGTGYSSFSYLVNLPISTLKIDRSFLFGIKIDDRRFVVLKAIVDLAHKLGINVVVEGIEDRDQLLAAQDSGCDEVQGYLFARPAAPDRIPHLTPDPSEPFYTAAPSLQAVPLPLVSRKNQNSFVSLALDDGRWQ
jgi:EAL domain-containing protein (putative c-di-GMP-specific phosphodiesterase class I)